MARSPDYLRLATSATRSLADTAFDSLRDAVLVVDIRPKHLPLVLANAAARGCLAAALEPVTLIDASLYGLLGPASASAIEAILASLSEGQSRANRMPTWRFGRGETAVMTELKILAAAPGQRLAVRSRDLYGLDVNFRAEVWPELTLSETSASHLYRVAQEALTNAARHGPPRRWRFSCWSRKHVFAADHG